MELLVWVRVGTDGRGNIGRCLAAFVLAMAVPGGGHVAAADDQLQAIRDRYRKSIESLLGISAHFEFQNTHSKGEYVQRGRWLRDGSKRLFTGEGRFSDGKEVLLTRLWAAFDGVHGYTAIYRDEKDVSPSRITQINKLSYVPDQVTEAYTVDCWLGLQLKSSTTNLEAMLQSPDCRVIERVTHDGFDAWLVDLGQHPFGGRMRHWTAVLSEHYDGLPVELISRSVVGPDDPPEWKRYQVDWRVVKWESVDDPLLERARWFPAEMESRCAEMGSMWKLRLSEIAINGSSEGVLFEPPPQPGTLIVDETQPGKIKRTVHQPEKVLSDQLAQSAPELSPPNPSSPPAVAMPTAAWTLTGVIRWVCAGLLAVAAVAYLRRVWA